MALNKKFIFTYIYFMMFFFFCNAVKVAANKTTIIEMPTATDLVYGEPLFQSNLVGGSANVEGKFSWEDGLVTFEVGQYTQKVIFNPLDSSYESCELYVPIKVNKKKVTLQFEKEIYKHYDGTTKIELPNYIVKGIVDDDVFVRGNLQGELEDALVGETMVLLSGLDLVGDKKHNYELDFSSVVGTVYRLEVEKFGTIKHKVVFKGETYVPANALINVDNLRAGDVDIEGYNVVEVYDIYLTSNGDRVDVSDLVEVKIKINEQSLNHKHLAVFNYYNGEYEEVEYKYIDGYIVYSAHSLGKLVIAYQKVNLSWLYGLGIFVIVFVATYVGIGKYRKREKINKYKSLKRRKEDGNC